jgi:hypothetical protein
MSVLTQDLKNSNVPLVSLMGKNLTWIERCKYLGVFLSNDRNDQCDITRQLRAIYARGNILIRKFSKCSNDVKLELFNSHCTNLYCSHLWSIFSSTALKKISVAYNNVFRFLLKVRGRCSISQLFVTNNICTFKELLRKAICKFRRRLLSSENTLISVITNSLFFISSSQLYKKWCEQIF